MMQTLAKFAIEICSAIQTVIVLPTPRHPYNHEHTSPAIAATVPPSPFPEATFLRLAHSHSHSKIKTLGSHSHPSTQPPSPPPHSETPAHGHTAESAKIATMYREDNWKLTLSPRHFLSWYRWPSSNPVRSGRRGWV